MPDIANSFSLTLTAFLSDNICGGSHRRLIAGWWYAILLISLVLTLLSLWVVSTRSSGEGFSSVWSSLILIVLSLGGTIVMRSSHNSMAVGLFMGAVIATSQLFFMMFLVYFGHGYDRHMQGLNVREERMLSILSILQCVFLASFAAILGSHRSEILDRSNAPQAIGVTNMVMTRTTTNGTTSKKMPNPQYNSEESNLESKGSYVPPNFIDD